MGQAGFYDIWRRLQGGAMANAVDRIERATEKDVSSALAQPPVSADGFLCLLSESADAIRGQVERAARSLTTLRFGHNVSLYIPIYLSNFCVNDCVYCSFARSGSITRKVLTSDELADEAEKLLDEGYRSVLLVSGEDKKRFSVKRLADAIRLMKSMGFVFAGIETEPLEVDEYKLLGSAGLDCVTVYQETYDEDIYAKAHRTGPKKDFRRRMETPERAASAGIRSVGLGVLLGLGPFLRDAVALCAHLKYIQKRYWQTMVSISFPRLHQFPESFKSHKPVCDDEFLRMILAMRLAFPDATLNLSTREPADLRDRLFGVGINQVSAGSRTNPGGYTKNDAHAGEQFPVTDDRTPEEVVSAIERKGLERVWKDWDENLKPVAGRGPTGP